MALDFFAGCLGGCAGVVVGHPFDTVKVRLQTQDFRNPQYKGAFNCFTSIVKKESVTGLYKGMSSPMAGVAVVNAIVFGVYGNFQRNLPNPNALSSHFMAGAAAGFVQSFVCSPMELVKTRLQLQQNCSAPGGVQYSGPINCLAQVVKKEGIRGVFRGLGTTICREIPGFGTYFLAYELMTRTSEENGEPGPPISTMHMLLAGGLSGTLSWVVVYPVDVIKSRLQVDGMGGSYKYNGFIDCFKKSVQAEGYGVLTRGVNSTILRAFPTNAATFTVVTWIIRWANANQVEDTSGYIIAELVDFPAEEYTGVTMKPGSASKLGAKLFGLENLESKEKFNNIFQWRKTILPNLMGNDVLSKQYFISQSNVEYPSAKDDQNDKLLLSGKLNETNLESYISVGNEVDSQIKENESQPLSNNAILLEDEEVVDQMNSTERSEPEKATTTYEHKNDYYNSSVR